MTKIPTLPLVTLFVGTIIVVYLIAWFLREDYGAKRTVRAYLIYIFPCFLTGLILRVNIVLIVGIYLFGAVILVFRNQHYFDR
jgi:hypothetical protein